MTDIVERKGVFLPGDRVEHARTKLLSAHGTVEHVDDNHVRVRWDDGQIGLLYFDHTTHARASDLIKLTEHSQACHRQSEP